MSFSLSLDFEPPCEEDPDFWFTPNTFSKAAEICMACPKRLACLKDALEYEQLAGELRWGVYGGTTPTERRHLAQQEGVMV